MDIKNLMYILEANKCHSINKAAQNVFISQSHLSSIIKNVETEVGYNIFIRTAAGLTATEEGLYFLDAAEKIVANWQSILEIPDRSGDRESLLVCCTPSASIFQCFLNYKKMYTTQSHDVFLEGGLKKVMGYILNQTCRIGILMMEEKQIDKYRQVAENYKLDFYVLRLGITMGVYMAKSHPLAASETVTKDDLAQYPVVININLVTDDRVDFSVHPAGALYVSDRGTTYEALFRHNYLLPGIINSANRNMKSCLCRPIADGDHMAVCFIKSRLCKPNQREQQFLLYLADEIKKF